MSKDFKVEYNESKKQWDVIAPTRGSKGVRLSLVEILKWAMENQPELVIEVLDSTDDASDNPDQESS